MEIKYNQTGPIILELADDMSQAKAIREIIKQWGSSEGPTLNNLICLTPRYAWIVLARDKYTPIPPLQAIDTVNLLVENYNPPDNYIPEAVNVVPNLSGLLSALEKQNLKGSMTRPLQNTVLANWDGVMLLYYELADKLLSAGRAELSCQVFASSLEHNRDFLYDTRWMEAMEMAALTAGDKTLPILGLPASEMLKQVEKHHAQSRPLPAITRGYNALLYYPIVEESEWNRVVDPPVAQRYPSLVNEVEILWEGVLLSTAFSPELPKESPDVKFFTTGAVDMIKNKWKKLTDKEQQRIDDFSMRISGQPLSTRLGLAGGHSNI